MDTKDVIIVKARQVFARDGYDGLSIRLLAKKANIASSVIYHHYANKDVLLRSMFDVTNTELGLLRKSLPKTDTPYEGLVQQIKFQFDHSEHVVAILKYYMAYRSSFSKLENGFIPSKAYLHIEEILINGVRSNVFKNQDIPKQAKMITHMINGFLLEYFPASIPTDEKDELATDLANFIYRGVIKC